jgi:hypothetical protein
MADNKKTPRSDISLDEILAEAQTMKKKEQPKAEKAQTGDFSQPKIMSEPKKAAGPEAIAEQAKRVLDAQTSALPVLSAAPEKKKGGKQKGFSLFNRRKRKFAEFEEEDDIYYGLQLKPLEDYRDDYERTIQINTGKIIKADSKKAENEATFSYLFQKADGDSADDEIAERFERLHNERQMRVQKILEKAGVEHDDIFSLYENSAQIKSSSQQSGPILPQEEPVTEPDKPAVIPQPQPAPIPAAPVQKPEIFPGPQREPEIRQPVVEPTFEPPSRAPTSPSPAQPGMMPGIQCLDSEEPVKEPVLIPEMKKEQPDAPPVKEPPARPIPRMSAAAGYRPAAVTPMHMVDVIDLTFVLSAEAASYPKVSLKPPLAPIPLPSRTAAPQNSANEIPVESLVGESAEKPTEEIEAIEDAQYKPPIIIEQTSEFTPIQMPAAPEEAGEELPPPAEPILFPELAIPDEDLMESEDESDEKPHKKKRFSLFGNEEEDNDSTDNLPGEQDELDDYSIPADAPSISHDLGSSLGKMVLRLAVTGISCVLLFIAGFLGEMSAMLPQAMQFNFGIQAYLIVNLVFLLVAVGFCMTAIFNGIKALFVLQANSDSAVAVAAVAAVIQSVALMFSQNSVKDGSLHLYTALVAMALFLNTAGKVSMLRRIAKNFRFIAAPDQKQAVQIFDDHNTSLQMAKGCVMDAPVIVFQTKTNFLKHFLRLSYEPDPSDQSSQTLAPILFVSSLILCIVTLVLSKDMFHALNAFAAATCISVPFVNMLSINLPLNRLSKIASRCGAMIVGYPAVEQFSSTNAVMVDAKELFPRGTVILNGIKTFAGQRIDDAIVDATALMCAVGGPLSDLFDQIIKSRRDMLPKIDNLLYEDDKGVTGWVSGRRILVGNRALMESHSIEPPSHDYEEKYISGGKKIVYLASGGDLVAMFVVSYDSDRRRALELRRMEDNGISLIVRTCDPNITPPLLAECFGLDEHCIRVLPERLGVVYNEITAEPQERSTAFMATKGRPTAMMRMLTACVRMRGNFSIAVALQTVSVIIGFVLVAFLTCYSGLQQLSTSALLIYELFWAFAVLFVPRLRKP